MAYVVPFTTTEAVIVVRQPPPRPVMENELVVIELPVAICRDEGVSTPPGLCTVVFTRPTVSAVPVLVTA